MDHYSYLSLLPPLIAIFLAIKTKQVYISLFFGIWLGYLAVRTNSLYVPILAHFTQNTLTILITNYADKLSFLNFIISDDKIEYWVVVPAIIIIYLVIKAFSILNPIILKENTTAEFKS